jgi:hypothetical protein
MSDLPRCFRQAERGSRVVMGDGPQFCFFVLGLCSFCLCVRLFIWLHDYVLDCVLARLFV